MLAIDGRELQQPDDQIHRGHHLRRLINSESESERTHRTGRMEESEKVKQDSEKCHILKLGPKLTL